MKSIIKNNKGISIIELVLVMAIIGIVLQVVYSLYFVGGNSFAVSNNKGFSQQGVRNVSMFLEGELKHASGFLTEEKVNEGISNTRFYGLKRDSDVFVVEQFDYISETEPMYEVSELKRYPITWEELVLKNDDFGKLNVFINQSETSGGLTSSYDLNFSMDLLNAHLVKTDNEWNFQMDDTVLYYTKTIDSDMGSINLNESVEDNPTDPEDDESGDEIGVPGAIDIYDIAINGTKLNINDGGYHYKVGNNNAFEIIIKYYYSGTISLMVDADNYNTDHNTEAKTIIISGSSPNGGWDSELTEVRISEINGPNFDEVTITLYK